MACSLVQGGPAPNFLAHWVYTYLTKGLESVSINPEDIKDEKFKDIALKVILYYINI